MKKRLKKTVTFAITEDTWDIIEKERMKIGWQNNEVSRSEFVRQMFEKGFREYIQDQEPGQRSVGV